MALSLDFAKPRFAFLGAWNRAVLQPQWIARHLFNYPEGQAVQVGVLVDAMHPNDQTLFIDEVGVSCRSDRVLLLTNSLEPEVVVRSERAAGALFATLPHTPLGPWGVNFAFVLEDAEDQLLDQLTASDALSEHYPLLGQTLTAGIRRDDGGVLNLSRQANGRNVAFDFNYHYELPPVVSDMPRRLTGITMTLYNESRTLLQTVYQIGQAAGGNAAAAGQGDQAREAGVADAQPAG
jgi:hypothetical protein